MNYRKVYDTLMARAIGRQLDEYSEQHHIVPRCMGGGNGANVVRLTYREHFLAHWLLTKFTAGDDRTKMLWALHYMTRGRKGRKIISSWQYAIARRAAVKADKSKSFIAKQQKGKIISAKIRSKVSASIKRWWANPETQKKMNGKICSLEKRAKISAAHKGRIFSAETRVKMSDAARRRKQIIQSPEWRAKIAAAHRGMIRSLEARAKMRAAKLGSTHSAETIAKMRAIKRRRNYLGQFESL